MPTTENIFVFSSILFLVVIELSNRFRNQKLGELASLNRDPIFFLPNLGVFSVIHALNTFLMMAGYLVVFSAFISGDETPIFLLWIIYVILLPIIPYLEVDDYETHLTNLDRFNSLHIHLLFSALILFIVPLLALLLPAIPWLANRGLDSAIAGSAFTLGILGGIYLFLRELKSELAEES